jgi:hypothetical protein
MFDKTEVLNIRNYRVVEAGLVEVGPAEVGLAEVSPVQERTLR